VFGNQVSLLTAHQGVAAALWIGAAIAWAGLIYCPFALAIKPAKPLLGSGLDGGWLLIVVGRGALAISATRAVRSLTMPEPLVLASLCLFALGIAFYLILLMLIVYRWLFWPVSPDQFVPSYWINRGAAAITALAGARLLRSSAPIRFWNPYLGALPFDGGGLGGGDRRREQTLSNIARASDRGANIPPSRSFGRYIVHFVCHEARPIILDYSGVASQPPPPPNPPPSRGRAPTENVA
jgi:hypothetical protein